jgi:hypothetical protein
MDIVFEEVANLAHFLSGLLALSHWFLCTGG